LLIAGVEAFEAPELSSHVEIRTAQRHSFSAALQIIRSMCKSAKINTAV
jgi:hypothetical protein